MSFNSFISSKNPGKGLYIFVWLVAWIPANGAVLIVDTLLAETIIKSVNDWNTYAIIAFPIESIVYLVIGIFIYKKFQNIKISKVMPFIWFFGAVNDGRLYFETTEMLKSAGVGTSVNSLMILFSYLILCIGFRQYFKNSRQW
ncbi:MAG: hypothetical protein HVK36_02970 [Pelagibacteraceae bacterium]|nr:hypothetical protein [Pelagibacteraceae bacterium]MBO6481829.1 hypothetical protein [Pelagibacteraceae bacterium]MBO6482490.1 hypothetical protein [Pelagibacteraceae bacterium]MBO6485692.1 hypothetical protein [Pelagibacteraceae bacterium]